MLAEHTASRSLFESISLQLNPSPTSHPPPPLNSELQEMLIISHFLVYNNIRFIKDIDITLMSIFIEHLTLPQITNAITPTILKRWLHLLKRSFRIPYSLLA